MKPEVIADTGWLKLLFNRKEHYYYAERKGRDSVGIILIDEPNVFVARERCPAHSRAVNLGAIGGSMEPGMTPMEVAIKEVREEGGYEVTERDMIPLGKIFASTQNNEDIHLFACDVSNKVYLGQLLEPSEVGYNKGGEWMPISPKLYEIVEDPRFLVALMRYLS